MTDFLAERVHEAVRAGYGFDVAMSMTPMQIMEVSKAEERRARWVIRNEALSTRAGMSSEEGWEKFNAIMIGDEDG